MSEDKTISISNIRNNYLKILDVINSLQLDLNACITAGRKQKTTDIEVVSLSLTAEFISVDCE